MVIGFLKMYLEGSALTFLFIHGFIYQPGIELTQQFLSKGVFIFCVILYFISLFELIKNK